MKFACYFSSRLLIVIAIVMQSAASFCQTPPVPKEIYDLYDEVLKYVDNLPKQTDLQPPPPPSVYYDYCFPCDKERQAAYGHDSIAFMDGYLGAEIGYIKKANSVMDYFKQKRVRKQPFDSLTFLKMSPKMLTARIVIAQKMQKKLVAAWKQYGSIPEKIPFLTRRILEQHRINELLGVKSESSLPSVGSLTQLEIMAMVRKFKKAREERDYPVLLNIDLIAATFRTASIVGLSESELGDNVMNYTTQTRFLFTIETKAKIQVEKAIFGAALSNQSIFAAKPDKDCHLKWTQVDPNDQRMTYDLKDIFMEIPDAGKPSYEGTKTYTSPAPQIKLDFCDDTRDTAHFYAFTTGKYTEQWSYKGQPMTGTTCPMTYIICFPDKKPYVEFERGGVVTAQSLFGFYVKQAPKNKEKIIVEKSIDAKEFTDQPEYVVYGEFKLKIEHVE